MIMIGCTDTARTVAPDVSGIEVDFDIVRFDQQVLAIDTNEVRNGIDKLMDQYPAATTLYFETLNPYTASAKRDSIDQALRAFLTEPFVQNLSDTIDIVFGDMSTIEFDMKQAYRYLKHYIPEVDVADLYTFNTLFNYQRFMYLDDDESNALGAGLELFLGRAYPYKKIDPQNSSFSAYLTRSFDKEHFVKKTIELVVDEELGNPPGARLIDQMIHNGKRLYMLDKILPEIPDSIIMEYTSEQMAWADDNRLEMWSYFFDQELFYETNMMKITKYLNHSPDSPGMPELAPGRTANYMGWQVIKAYMKKYPETTFRELIGLTDAQQLLEKSKYKPRQ